MATYPGQKEIDYGMTLVGAHETGPNTDHGGIIDRIIRAAGFSPGPSSPWCGMFELWCANETDSMDLYDGLLSAATQTICERASNRGWWWNGSDHIPPGALWINCGVHTCFVRQQLNSSTIATLEGNHGDAIRADVRNTHSGRIIIPPKLTVPVPPPVVTTYWLEDIRARPTTDANGHVHSPQFVMGAWRSEATRNKWLKQWANDPDRGKYHPRPHRISKGGKPMYLIIGGPIRYYGGYATKEMREQARRILVPRLRAYWNLDHGEQVFRDFSKTKPA